MRLSLEDPVFLTILLVAAILFAVALIAVAVFLVLRSRKDKGATEGKKPEERRQWLPATAPGMAVSFREAMKKLGERLPGWGYRYSVPWYALVGESGSGKTAIAEALSGGSAEPIAPAGGDYAPQWLLLDQAVLIDLPGRSFLSPPSVDQKADPAAENKARQDADQKAWRSFLRLLARYRPRQPLNGIVLTVPASDLLLMSDDPDHPRQIAKIAALSQRLDEIQHSLRLSLPVYVLVTKCDTVNGFATYSRALFEEALSGRAGGNGHSAEIVGNLFGWSSPYLLESTYSSDWVDEAFDEIYDVLLQRQLEMLAESTTARAADGVLQFPFELQRLRAPMQATLNGVFKATAYHAPHVLRGIYFCGREEERAAKGVAAAQSNGTAASAVLARGLVTRPSNSVLYIRHLFEFKVFAERYLATPIGRGFLSGNRSVLAAQLVAGALAIFLAVASIEAWARLDSLQKNRIGPVLRSLADSLDREAVSSTANLPLAVDVFSTLGAARENEYYSWAMPYSYLDLDGFHRELSNTLEQTFEVAILRSCKFAMEGRIAAVMNLSASSPAPTSQMSSISAAYPPGTAWTSQPAYRELDGYLSELQKLDNNIGRYQLISGAGSGSFRQLNALLAYLGGRNLPDTGTLAQDADYQKLLLHATWEPLEVPANLDPVTAAATKRRIANFYAGWFDANPLTGEVQWIDGRDGLAGLSSVEAPSTNQHLRAFVSRAQAMEDQLRGGSYDWLAEEFDRERYPALGAKLEQMHFADSQFLSDISREGAERQAALRDAVDTEPEVLDVQDGKVRLAGPVRTLASALDALLGYDLMSDAYDTPIASGCHLIPPGTVWDSDTLTRAIDLEAMRGKIEAELLPGVPDEYREAVAGLVDRRAETALGSVLQSAAVPNPALGDARAALQSELQGLGQSMDKLKEIEAALSRVRAAAEVSCLNRSLTREANSLLARINLQLPALYGHAGDGGNVTGELPVSLWLYGVASAEDLQAYLSSEHQRVETLSSEAAPLVQLLTAAGGHSETLTRWHNISQDIAAFQAQKPGNPIQALESFIATYLDKVTPEANCKSPSPAKTVDVFLNVRAQLSSLAVTYCHQVAVNRFNRIAADFNQRLAGHFPFSSVVDTRPGVEADSAEIAAFYKEFDTSVAGLATVVPGAVQRSEEVIAFLQAVAAARPLVTAETKDMAPALGLSIHFRTNRNRENLGNRIADWEMRVGQQTLQSPLDGEGPPAIWHLGDAITLSVRYANNSPEVPAAANPSPAAAVQGRTVTYRYSDSWSLFAMLRDHPPGPGDPPNQYAFAIPNVASASGAHSDTVVYIQIDPLPVGAKPGGETLPVPVFPYRAPIARLKNISGE